MTREEIIAALAGRKKKSDSIHRWGAILSREYSITELFTEEGGASVALYEPERDAESAALFIGELSLHGIPVDCFITDDPAGRALGEQFGVACVPCKDIARVKADFVVILSSDDYSEYIRRRVELRSALSAEIISLKGLIELTFAGKFIFSLLKNSERVKTYILGWPRVGVFNDLGLLAQLEKIRFTPAENQENPDPERFQFLFGDIEEYSDNYIRELFQEVPLIREGDLSLQSDCVGRFVNIVNHRRVTVGQPGRAEYGIYIRGGCMPYGYASDDRYTLASCLQRIINDYYGSVQNTPCAVYNLAVRGGDDSGNRDFMMDDDKKGKVCLAVLRADLEYPKGEEGRIQRYLKKSANECGAEYLDLAATLYEAEKRLGVFFDSTHTNHRGFKAVADMIWRGILKPLFESGELFTDGPPDALPLSEKWRALRAHAHSASEFFDGGDVRSVGILYDAEKREMIADLAGDLTRSGIDVTLLMDDTDAQAENPAVPDAKCVKLSEAEAGERPALAFVIPATVQEIGWTKERLKGLFGAEVVALNDVIGLMWDRHFFYPKIAEELGGSAAYLCVCLWPGVGDLGLPLSLNQARLAGEFASAMPMENYAYLKTYLYNELPAFTKDYLHEILREDSGSAPSKNADRKGPGVNVKGGVRRTVGQPAAPKRRVHIFGGGVAFGIGAEDSQTIASLLQEQLNLRSKSTNAGPIKVENEGVCRNSVRDLEVLGQGIARKLRGGDIKDGDIILWLIDKRYAISESDGRAFAYLTASLTEQGAQLLDLTPALRMAQEKLAYIDKRHVNQRGNRVAAMKLYMDYIKRAIEGDLPIPSRHQKVAPPPAGIATEMTEDAIGDDLTGEQNAESAHPAELVHPDKGPGKKGAHRKGKRGSRR